MASFVNEYKRGLVIAAIMAVVVIAALGVASNQLFPSKIPSTQPSPIPSPTQAPTQTETETKTETITTTVPGTTTKTTTIGPTTTSVVGPTPTPTLAVGFGAEGPLAGDVMNNLNLSAWMMFKLRDIFLLYVGDPSYVGISIDFYVLGQDNQSYYGYALIEGFLIDGNRLTTNVWNVSITPADYWKDIFVYDWLGPVSSNTTTPQQKNYFNLETRKCGEIQIDDTLFHYAILNQSYHTIWEYSVPSTITFEGVRFVFPPDLLITPAGPQIKVNVTFPDGSEESLIGNIIFPSQTSVIALTETKNPQAGVELNVDGWSNGEIKLLVSLTPQLSKGLPMESIGLVIAVALVVVAYLYFTRLKKSDFK